MPIIKPSKKTKKKGSSIFNAKIPFLGLTAIELIILAVVIGGGTVAVVYRNNKNSPPKVTVSTVEKLDQPTKSAPTPTSVQETPKTNTPTAGTSVSPQKTAASEADRCLGIQVYFMGKDIDSFNRDNSSLRERLASYDLNANLRTIEENNALKNRDIKNYNDIRSVYIAAYKQSMIDNGCPNYTAEPNPGYVDYF